MTGHGAGPARDPRPGDMLLITRTASVQFTQRIVFRVIRVHDWSTYDGWIWLDGYQMDAIGQPSQRRSIFVQPAGLIWLQPGALVPGRALSRRDPGAGTRNRPRDVPHRSGR